MSKRNCLHEWTLAIFITMGVRIPQSAYAGAGADFYKDKSIDILIGATTGNDFDLRGRMLARHMGKYIPGQPNLIVACLAAAALWR